MNVNATESIFKDLYAGIITEYSFDPFNNIVSFCVDITDGGVTQTHKIVFHDVISILFFNDTSKECDNITVFEAVELSSIGVLRDGNISVSSKYDKWLSQYSSCANIYIEVWNNLILLQAGSVLIDSKLFLL